MNDRFQCSILCLYFLLCCRFVQYAAFWRETEDRLQKINK